MELCRRPRTFQKDNLGRSHPWLEFLFQPGRERLGAIVVRSEPPNFIRQLCDLFVWDLPSGNEILRLPCRSSGFYGLSFNPDGTHLVTIEWSGPEVDATSDANYLIKILNVADGEIVRALPATVGFVYSMLFSPDGLRIAVSSCKKGERGEITIYDAGTFEKIQSWKTASGWDLRLAFSSDGKRLASWGLDASVNVWEVATAELKQALKGHTTPVADAVFSRDGNRLVSADCGHTIKFWDISLHDLPPAQHDEPDTFIVGAVTADLSRVAICKSSIVAPPPGVPTPQRLIRVLDRNDHDLFRFHVAAEIVNSLEFSPDGQWLTGLVISQREKQSRIVVWDVANGKELVAFKGLSGKEFSVFSGGVSLSKDGTRLVARLQMANLGEGTDENLLKVWNTATWAELCVINGGRNSFANVDISPDNKWLVSVGVSPEGISQVKLWDVATGREIGDLKAQGSGLSDQAISPDGKQIAIASSLMKSVQLFDTASRNELFLLQGLSGPVQGLTFSPDGRRIAACTNTQGGDMIVKLWDAATGEEVLTLKLEAGAGAQPWGFSSDGNYLFALNRFYRRTETGLKVWNAKPMPED